MASPPLSPLSYQTAHSAMHALAPRSHSSVHIFMPSPIIYFALRVLSDLRERGPLELSPSLNCGIMELTHVHAMQALCPCYAVRLRQWHGGGRAGWATAGGLEGGRGGLPPSSSFSSLSLSPHARPLSGCPLCLTASLAALACSLSLSNHSGS